MPGYKNGGENITLLEMMKIKYGNTVSVYNISHKLESCKPRI